jgi:hypothetical protein
LVLSGNDWKRGGGGGKNSNLLSFGSGNINFLSFGGDFLVLGKFLVVGGGRAVCSGTVDTVGLKRGGEGGLHGGRCLEAIRGGLIWNCEGRECGS